MTGTRWWFCRTCEAANSASVWVCEVCEAAVPVKPATKVPLRAPLSYRGLVAPSDEAPDPRLRVVAHPFRWWQTPWVEACVAPLRRAYNWCAEAVRELGRALR